MSCWTGLLVEVHFISSSTSSLPRFSSWFFAASQPWLLAYLKYMFEDAWKYEKAPGPLGGRGTMAMAMVAWLHVYAVYQMLSIYLSSSDSVQKDASRGRHHSSSCGRGAGEASARVSFKSECLLMVPCKAVRRTTSTCSALKAEWSRAHKEAGQRRERGVPHRSEPRFPSTTQAPDAGGEGAGKMGLCQDDQDPTSRESQPERQGISPSPRGN